MKTIFLTFIGFLIIGIVPGLDLQAKVYKWVDEDGYVQYTQFPPLRDSEKDSKTTEVIIKPTPKIDSEQDTSDTDVKKNKSEESVAPPTLTEENTEKSMGDKEYQQELKSVCESAKRSLKSFQRPRVNLKNDDGSMRVATEEERQEGIARAEAAIKKYCQ